MTPMQELIETFKEIQKDQDPFSVHEAIELAEAMLEKEEEMMVDFAYMCRNIMAADVFAISLWYNKTFKTKER